MKPVDIPNSITAAELAALGESGPGGGTFPRSVSPSEAMASSLAPDPLDQQVANLLAGGGKGTSPGVAATGAGGTSPVRDVERHLFGELADPEARRALDDLAGRTRRALDAGATEASRYTPCRVPVATDEVIYQSRPATVLRVREPGNPMSALDLLRERDGDPEALARVEHDRDAGWHWLGEPPPPDPTPADRVRAAIAAGRPVPKVGDIVRLIRAKPRSFRGIEMIALRAKVLAQVDVVGQKITLDLEVLDDLVDGLDPATASGIVRGVEGPDEHREGWSISARPSHYQKPDTRNLHQQPCDRCGGKIVPAQAVQFLSRIHGDYSNPTLFAQLCPTCADQFGRLAFVMPPAPELLDGPTDDESDELA